jgi:hypothetical protein
MQNDPHETPRDRFYQVMRFACPGRTLATLGGIWPSTLARWHAEGLPAAIDNVPDLIDYLGLQPHLWSGPAVNLFAYPAFDYEVLARTADKITYRNGNGIVCTEFVTDNYQSMPHFEAFPVRTPRDWREYRPRLAWDAGRIRPEWPRQREAWQARTAPLILYLDRAGSLYGAVRDLMGVEGASYAFFDEPEMVADMMDTVVALFCAVCDALLTDGFVPDAVCLWEDMGFNTASLLSPRLVREFMLPRYRIMTAKLREKGVPFIVLDSDGQVGELIPLWLEAGIDGVVPMEVQAGMDVAVYRERYPQLLMLGGVDKKALAAGRTAIDREMDKIARVVATGGLIPWFDHGLPHDVAYDDFRYFVTRLKQVAGVG